MKSKWLPAAALVLALAVRLAFVSRMGPELQWPDARHYDRIAQNMVEGRGFTIEPLSTKLSIRPPLYPLFLTGVYAAGGGVREARVLQAFMGAALVLLVYSTACWMFSRSTALLAAAASAVYPLFIYFTGALLTETLFLVMMAACAYSIIRLALRPAVQESRARMVLAGLAPGILWGLASLTRPVAIVAVLFAWGWAVAVAGAGRRRLLHAVPVMVLACAAVVAPWTVRNYAVHGCFVPVTTQAGWVLYESANPLATGGTWEEREIPIAHELVGLSEIEWSRHLRRRAMEFIRENPGKMAWLAVQKQARFWNPVPNAKELRTKRNIVIGLLSSGVMLVCALVGTVCVVRRGAPGVLLLGPVIYYTLVHCVFLGSIRYRLPVEPFLIILAAHGMMVVVGSRRAGRNP